MADSDLVLAAYREHNENLREMLGNLQWLYLRSAAVQSIRRCVMCGSMQEEGHADECELDALLSVNVAQAYEAQTARRAAVRPKAHR